MLFLSASGMFRMMLCILLNVLPYSCFVKKSLSMFVVGQNATLTSPFLSCLLQSSTIHLCGMFSLNLRICHFLLVISCSCYLGILSWLVVSCFFYLGIFSWLVQGVLVWLFMSGCTTYELSTHHFGSSPFVFLKYCITFVSFL